MAEVTTQPLVRSPDPAQPAAPAAAPAAAEAPLLPAASFSSSRATGTRTTAANRQMQDFVEQNLAALQANAEKLREKEIIDEEIWALLIALKNTTPKPEQLTQLAEALKQRAESLKLSPEVLKQLLQDDDTELTTVLGQSAPARPATDVAREVIDQLKTFAATPGIESSLQAQQLLGELLAGVAVQDREYALEHLHAASGNKAEFAKLLSKIGGDDLGQWFDATVRNDPIAVYAVTLHQLLTVPKPDNGAVAHFVMQLPVEAGPKLRSEFERRYGQSINVMAAAPAGPEGAPRISAVDRGVLDSFQSGDMRAMQEAALSRSLGLDTGTDGNAYQALAIIGGLPAERKTELLRRMEIRAAERGTTLTELLAKNSGGDRQHALLLVSLFGGAAVVPDRIAQYTALRLELKSREAALSEGVDQLATAAKRAGESQRGAESNARKTDREMTNWEAAWWNPVAHVTGLRSSMGRDSANDRKFADEIRSHRIGLSRTHKECEKDVEALRLAQALALAAVLKGDSEKAAEHLKSAEAASSHYRKTLEGVRTTSLPSLSRYRTELASIQDTYGAVVTSCDRWETGLQYTRTGLAIAGGAAAVALSGGTLGPAYAAMLVTLAMAPGTIVESTIRINRGDDVGGVALDAALQTGSNFLGAWGGATITSAFTKPLDPTKLRYIIKGPVNPPKPVPWKKMVEIVSEVGDDAFVEAVKAGSRWVPSIAGSSLSAASAARHVPLPTENEAGTAAPAADSPDAAARAARNKRRTPKVPLEPDVEVKPVTDDQRTRPPASPGVGPAPVTVPDPADLNPSAQPGPPAIARKGTDADAPKIPDPAVNPIPRTVSPPPALSSSATRADPLQPSISNPGTTSGIHPAPTTVARTPHGPPPGPPPPKIEPPSFPSVSPGFPSVSVTPPPPSGGFFSDPVVSRRSAPKRKPNVTARTDGGRPEPPAPPVAPPPGPPRTEPKSAPKAEVVRGLQPQMAPVATPRTVVMSEPNLHRQAASVAADNSLNQHSIKAPQPERIPRVNRTASKNRMTQKMFLQDAQAQPEVEALQESLQQMTESIPQLQTAADKHIQQAQSLRDQQPQKIARAAAQLEKQLLSTVNSLSTAEKKAAEIGTAVRNSIEQVTQQTLTQPLDQSQQLKLSQLRSIELDLAQPIRQIEQIRLKISQAQGAVQEQRQAEAERKAIGSAVGHGVPQSESTAAPIATPVSAPISDSVRQAVSKAQGVPAAVQAPLGESLAEEHSAENRTAQAIHTEAGQVPAAEIRIEQPTIAERSTPNAHSRMAGAEGVGEEIGAAIEIPEERIPIAIEDARSLLEPLAPDSSGEMESIAAEVGIDLDTRNPLALTDRDIEAEDLYGEAPHADSTAGEIEAELIEDFGPNDSAEENTVESGDSARSPEAQTVGQLVQSERSIESGEIPSKNGAQPAARRKARGTKDAVQPSEEVEAAIETRTLTREAAEKPAAGPDAKAGVPTLRDALVRRRSGARTQSAPEKLEDQLDLVRSKARNRRRDRIRTKRKEDLLKMKELIEKETTNQRVKIGISPRMRASGSPKASQRTLAEKFRAAVKSKTAAAGGGKKPN